MLDYIKKTAVGATALMLSSLAVSAAPVVNFDINPGGVGGSSVALSNITGFGAFNPTATIAIPDPTQFSLGTGDKATFDFITWDVGDNDKCVLCYFDVTATLVFDAPPGSVTGTGEGGAVLVVAGAYAGGFLEWDNPPIPATFFSPNGSEFLVDFEGGKQLLASSTTTTASVEGINVVPLPAPFLLLLGGMAGLGFVSRKRQAA